MLSSSSGASVNHVLWAEAVIKQVFADDGPLYSIYENHTMAIYNNHPVVFLIGFISNTRTSTRHFRWISCSQRRTAGALKLGLSLIECVSPPLVQLCSVHVWLTVTHEPVNYVEKTNIALVVLGHCSLCRDQQEAAFADGIYFSFFTHCFTGVWRPTFTFSLPLIKPHSCFGLPVCVLHRETPEALEWSS